MEAWQLSSEWVIQEKSLSGATSVISVLMLLIKKAQKSNVFFVVTVFMIFYIFMNFMRFFSPYFVFNRSRLYTTDVPFHYWSGILNETGYHKYIIKLHGHLKYRRYTSSRKIGFCWMRDVGSIEGCKGVLMPLFHISRSYIS